MQNYFEIFHLNINEKIDLNDLENKYLNFQKQFHPDNASSSDIEKSILINDAYEVLKDPIKRYAYILKENGIDILDDSKAPKVDPQTLATIWDLQEKLLETSKEEKQQLKQELKVKINNFFDEIHEEIKNENYEKAAQDLIRTKYYNKILKDLR